MDMRGCRTGILKNILKNSYIGCCMAFRKELRKYILPFPENIPMHDQWIGLIGEITGKNVNTLKANYHFAVEKIKKFINDNAI